MKRDYYDVLELKTDCTDEEIKKSYRRLALKYHPDKNQSEDAKQIFQELARANEVLSDPNERTWYDTHKNNILRGDEMSEEDFETMNAFGFDVWVYFRFDYLGYGDDPKGFYAFYRSAFEQIKMHELKAFNSRTVQQEDSSSEEVMEYEKLPGFGISTTDENTMLRFYQKWENFTTYQNFSWADKYNPNEGPSRYVKRLIVKDNKKDRVIEKKKYLRTVRQLVDSVKNRDPRWKLYLETNRRDSDIQKVIMQRLLQEKQQQREMMMKQRRGENIPKSTEEKSEQSVEQQMKDRQQQAADYEKKQAKELERKKKLKEKKKINKKKKQGETKEVGKVNAIFDSDSDEDEDEDQVKKNETIQQQQQQQQKPKVEVLEVKVEEKIRWQDLTSSNESNGEETTKKINGINGQFKDKNSLEKEQFQQTK